MKPLPGLGVIGTGAVSPAGVGTLPLLQEPGPPLQEPLLSHPEKSVAVRRVNMQDDVFRRWQQEPRLRRASPLALFLMEAASQALAASPELDRQRLGLVCALGTGSINYTRRFFADTIKRGRRFASPALFPETVYNSPVSHVASMLGIEGASYSMVGDESAWVEALRVAQVWLACGKADAVLVLAGEELDTITVEAFDKAGWIKKGAVPSEGAGALLVGKAAASNAVLSPDPETSFFRSPLSHQEAWKNMAEQKTTDQSLLLPGNIVHQKSALEWASNGARSGPDWGAAFTASSAWATLQMIASKQSGTLLVPGSNCGISRIQTGN